MHTTRDWNLPLGLGLFGAAVLLRGTILAYPETRSPPSNVDVSDPIATRPFPSFPDEVPAVAGERVTTPPNEPFARPFAPPAAVGGGPRSEPVEREEGDRPQSASPIKAPPPLPAPTTRASTVSTVTTAAMTPPSPPAAAPSIDAGLSAPVQASPSVSDASAIGTTEAALTSTDAGTTAVGDADYSNTPAIVPMYGAPTMSTGASMQVPSMNGGLGSAGGSALGGAGGGTALGAGGGPALGAGSGTALGGGDTTLGGGGATDAGVFTDTGPLLGAGGGATGTNTNAESGVETSVVDPAAAISAPLLVPMSTTTESFWTSIKPFLTTGDLVVARDSAAVGFAERAKTDAPLVTYVVAFDSPATLHASLEKLPAAVSTLGLSAAGLNEASLIKASDAVHAVGRRFFISTNVPANGPSLATIGAHADVVELVIAGDIPAAAKATAATMGPKTQLFVRLPDVSNGATAASMSKQIVTSLPSAGVSIPAVANVTALLTSYRKR